MTVGVEGEGGQGSPGSEARVVRVEAGGSQACGAMQTGNEGVIMWYKHSIPMIELRGKKNIYRRWANVVHTLYTKDRIRT